MNIGAFSRRHFAGLFLLLIGVCWGVGVSAEETGFVPIFNGKDFSGWEGDFNLWKVENGMIVGDSSGIRKNNFLATQKTYGDFELRLKFRLKKGTGNTGIQFRSRRVPDSHEVEGYQADIGETYWGCLYDEHRRRKTLVHAPAELMQVLKKEDWNDYWIRAKGNKISLTINGLETVNYQEQEPEIATSGIIALQIHSGDAMRIEFRNLRIREL